MARSGCPAALTFRVAPWIEVRCHRAPGHPTKLHEAKATVGIHGAPNSWDPDASNHKGPTSAVTWLTWEQDVSDPEEGPR